MCRRADGPTDRRAGCSIYTPRPVFDRFPQDSKNVMRHAREEAFRLRHDFIGAEHMLLGLLREERCAAVQALQRAGVDPGSIRREVEARCPPGTAQVTTGQLPFTLAGKHVLERAMAEASEAGATWIGTEHLLLGLIGVRGTAAAEVLRESGLTVEALRQHAAASRSPGWTPKSDSVPDRDEIVAVLDWVAQQAGDWLRELDRAPVRRPGAAEAAATFDHELPERGAGAMAALRELLEQGRDAVVFTGGPRSFGFVIGGVTPAALGADWLASALDQIAYAWVTSPLAVQLERVSLRWLAELFGLAPGIGGVMTTGATMANFTCLAAARQSCAQRLGFDAAEQGLAAHPPIPVLTSGFVHASTVKCLAMLGLGRASLRCFAVDDSGRLDLAALEAALAERRGAPSIVVANAAEVNTGAFDPIADLAELAARHGAWLHVDGAFGLFAALSPTTAPLVRGVERADSVTTDGHKWLNVPYDCGVAFVRDPALLAKAFAYSADYLPDPRDPRPNFGYLGPESSRRARAFAVWATLRAYGRHGYERLVERCLALARRLAERVDTAPDLERLADVPLNVVCFRYHPAGVDEPARLDTLNEALGAAIVSDGRVYAGSTRWRGAVALRPAIVNWRTREEDIDAFVDVVRELGARLPR